MATLHPDSKRATLTAAFAVLQDRSEVLKRAKAAGVAAIVVTGCTLKSATAARDLCDSITDYPLYFTAGVHPHNAKQCDEHTLDALRALASHQRCVAIGEATRVLA
jgi:TatD DNase family protein